MSIVKDIKVKITGQVQDNLGDNDYEIVLAKLRVICVEYDLELKEDLK